MEANLRRDIGEQDELDTKAEVGDILAGRPRGAVSTNAPTLGRWASKHDTTGARCQEPSG